MIEYVRATSRTNILSRPLLFVWVKRPVARIASETLLGDRTRSYRIPVTLCLPINFTAALLQQLRTRRPN